MKFGTFKNSDECCDRMKQAVVANIIKMIPFSEFKYVSLMNGKGGLLMPVIDFCPFCGEKMEIEK